MSYTPSLKKQYTEEVVPALMKEFNYKSAMQVPRLTKIVLNQGVGQAIADRGNYTLGIEEQIIFPEILLDEVNKIMGMNITFVTSANTDEEAYALLKEFGLPFKNIKK